MEPKKQLTEASERKAGTARSPVKRDAATFRKVSRSEQRLIVFGGISGAKKKYELP